MRALFIATALIATAAAPALADAPAYRIHVADLDLSTHDGKAALNHRIARALEATCGSYASVATRDADEITQCRVATRAGIARVVASLPSTTALAVR